jgi:hypothetical protein
MTSEKQMEANRSNALKSTGPCSPAGKARVAQNAVKHGLLAQDIVIEGESQAAFDYLRDRLLVQLAPVGEVELLLAERIIASYWRLRRAGRIEVDLFEIMKDNVLVLNKELHPERIPTSRPDLGIAVALDLSSINILSKLRRYETQVEHTMYRALHELQRLQAARLGQKVTAPVAIDIDISGPADG